MLSEVRGAVRDPRGKGGLQSITGSLYQGVFQGSYCLEIPLSKCSGFLCVA